MRGRGRELLDCRDLGEPRRVAHAAEDAARVVELGPHVVVELVQQQGVELVERAVRAEARLDPIDLEKKKAARRTGETNELR